MTESVYKVIELIGTSKDSWEKAAAAAVERAGKSLRELRVAEIAQLDLQLDCQGQDRSLPRQTQGLVQVRGLTSVRSNASRQKSAPGFAGRALAGCQALIPSTALSRACLDGWPRVLPVLETGRANLTAPTAAVTETLIAPCASAITRSVLESKAMSASRRLLISAATRTPSSFFWKSAIAAAIFFCALAANGLRSTSALSASTCCRCGIAARAAAPSSPNAASGFDGELNIGQPQRLLRLIEHAACPRYARWPRRRSRTGSSFPWRAPAAKSAAGRRTPRRVACLTVTSTEPEPSSGKVRPANCASTILLMSVNGRSIGTPMTDPARHRRDDGDLLGERAVGLGLASR